MVINYSDFDFENTARAVYIMNESAQEQYDSWFELQEFMFSMAYQYSRAEYSKTNSFATGGFNLAFTRSEDNEEVYITPSVSSFVALRYAEKIKDRFETIRLQLI